MKETVGDRVRRLRIEVGLSQRELAEPGVSFAYISRIEGNTRAPSVKALRKIAPKLGVSAEYLETGFDETPTDRLYAQVAAFLYGGCDDPASYTDGSLC